MTLQNNLLLSLITQKKISAKTSKLTFRVKRCRFFIVIPSCLESFRVRRACAAPSKLAQEIEFGKVVIGRLSFGYKSCVIG